MSKVKISPVSFVRGQPDAEVLVVTGVRDDFHGSCSFVWQLFTADQVETATRKVPEKQDDGTTKLVDKDVSRTLSGVLVANGQTSITGVDYTGWDGNNDFPVQYVAKQLDLTILS